jgi:hypothetical protein
MWTSCCTECSTQGETRLSRKTRAARTTGSSPEECRRRGAVAAHELPGRDQLFGAERPGQWGGLHARVTAGPRTDEAAHTGRSRSVKDADGNRASAQELNEAGLFSPDREQKAHWHISADILERFAPVVTEPAFAAMSLEEAADREAGLPVVYFADQVPVKRGYARSSSLNSSPVVWTALVVTRTGGNTTRRPAR